MVVMMVVMVVVMVVVMAVGGVEDEKEARSEVSQKEEVVGEGSHEEFGS